MKEFEIGSVPVEDVTIRDVFDTIAESQWDAWGSWWKNVEFDHDEHGATIHVSGTMVDPETGATITEFEMADEDLVDIVARLAGDGEMPTGLRRKCVLLLAGDEAVTWEIDAVDGDQIMQYGIRDCMKPEFG